MNPCNGVFILCQAQLLIDDQLNRHCTTHTFFCRGSNGLVICIGVQRIAIIIDGIQCLKGRSDVV